MKISLAGAVIEYGSLMAEHMVEAIRPDDSIRDHSGLRGSLTTG